MSLHGARTLLLVTLGTGGRIAATFLHRSWRPLPEADNTPSGLQIGGILAGFNLPKERAALLEAYTKRALQS